MDPQDLDKLNHWDALSAEEQKELKKKIRLMYWAQFHEECGCLLYGIWICLAGLILCAGYRAFTGGRLDNSNAGACLVNWTWCG